MNPTTGEHKIKVVIPFRDRGTDLRRAANLEVVMAWWWAHGFSVVVQDDGYGGVEQFNRHRAYNRAVEKFPETDVFVFSEADMLIHPKQIMLAIRLAVRKPGLVVPFTRYHYLSDSMTEVLRDDYNDSGRQKLAEFWSRDPGDPTSVFGLKPESTMENGRSVGAVNVVSRETLELTGGYTEMTQGNWYDDRIIEEGWRFLTGNQTQYVAGPAVHLYHLPGHEGDHLTDEDRLATQRNKVILMNMRTYIRNSNTLTVRSLMAHRRRS